MCSDLPPINGTVDEFIDFAQQLSEISKAAGDVNALFRLACVGRTIRPKWRFDGMAISTSSCNTAGRILTCEKDHLKEILVFLFCEWLALKHYP